MRFGDPNSRARFSLHCRGRHTQGGDGGFTLVELLVVIGVIVVLAAILLPVLGQARERSRRAVCLANVRSLAQAWTAFAVANDGMLPSSDTAQTGWVVGGNSDNDIRHGTLYQYVPNPQVFRCPNDHNAINGRSYSINDYLNGNYSPNDPAWPHIKRLSAVKRPAQTFVFIEEYDPRGFNLGSFALPRHGDSWVDYPVNWHNGGCNVSFADGHAEYFQFLDKRTAQIRDFYASTPNNPDLKKLQSWVGYD